MKDNYVQINLDDYIQSGEGGTAVTYNRKDGSALAKLFNPGLQADTAAREFHICQVVYELGIPSPKPIRLVTDGTRYGAEYELIAPKRSFSRIISEEPEQLEPLSIRFAQLASQLHSLKADTTKIPSMKELMQEWIERQREGLPEKYYKAMTEFLETVPDTDTCLHGDLHIGNVIRSNGKDYWIDLGDFAHGVPEWDLGMMYFLNNGFLGPERTVNMYHNSIETLKRHWNIFACAYYGTDSEQILGKKLSAIMPYVAVKMFYNISKLGYGVSPFALNILDKFLLRQ